MTWIGERMSSGKRVLIHCVGRLGRAGTVAGCWLKQQGLEGDAAIAVVREFRSARAIETKEQETIVRLF